MLNARLYRTAWLVAGVAIIVALLTLQPPAANYGMEQPSAPAAADGTLIRTNAMAMRSLAPHREPGSSANENRAARWVEQRFRALPSFPGSQVQVRRQIFSGRINGEMVRMTNVYAVLPGSTDGIDRGGIVVVAPRDTAPGVLHGTISTALMLEVARFQASTVRRRPMLFVSTSGSTTGNAGARWFLNRFSDFNIAAVVVLDGLGENDGPTWIWSGAREPKQALAFDSIVRETFPWSGSEAVEHSGLWTQLIRFAVPQTFGDHAPFIERGIPAVALSSHADGPARRAEDFSDVDRLRRAGNQVIYAMNVVDAGQPIAKPESGVLLAGNELRPVVLRAMLFLLALPLWVAAVDAFARLRRVGVRLGPGITAVWRRAVPLVVALFGLHLLALVGLFARPAAGAPPYPDSVGFGWKETLAVTVAALVGVGAWFWTNRLLRREAFPPASEAAAALVVGAVLTFVAWIVTPYVLVLTLPAAHAVLVATSVRRRWQAVALGLIGLTPLVGLCISVGSQIDRNPFYAAWYLVATTAGGARGTTLPVFALALACAVWSMAILVAVRFRKGLMRRDEPPRPSRRATVVTKARLPRISR